MIKIENVETYAWETAVRGMRNPMNSWDKSDSGYGCGSLQCDYCGLFDCQQHHTKFVLGPNDLDLACRLVKAGSDHSKFMRQILVSMDITAPLYWWKEFDTYKVGTVANSCSTMHKIHSKPFTREDFSHERLTDDALYVLDALITYLNGERVNFNNTGDKSCWHNIIQLLPSSYNQRRTVTLNYAVLRNMYHARKHHKLDEWRDFCHELSILSYAKELICDGV